MVSMEKGYGEVDVGAVSDKDFGKAENGVLEICRCKPVALFVDIFDVVVSPSQVHDAVHCGSKGCKSPKLMRSHLRLASRTSSLGT